jgi:hypothetical protein
MNSPLRHPSPPAATIVLVASLLLLPRDLPAQAAPPSHPEATPVEIEVGQSYGALTRVTSPNTGVSWVIPEDWTGGMPEASSAFLMASDAGEGAGAVLFIPETSVGKLAHDLDEVQDLGDGVVMEPMGEPVIGESRVLLDYENDLLEGRALALMGPGKLAVVFFLAGPPGNLDRLGGILESLASGARFPKPDVTERAGTRDNGVSRKPDTKPRNGPWYDLLAGMMLKQLSSYSSGSSGGYSSTTVFHLCRDGSFSYYSGGSVSVYVEGATGGGTNESRDSGRWSVEVSGQEAFLVLDSDSGESVRLQLYYDGEKTFVNGARYFRVASDACP